MKISVVIPAYNEAANLKEVIPQIFRVLPGCEVLLVNDASTDDTGEVARSLGAVVLDNPYNMGNGASVKRGMRAASGDVVVLMDADGQHLPDQIPHLLEHIDRYDMVVGCRGRGVQKFWRKGANTVYNVLASYVSNFKIQDLTSGFRAFKRERALQFIYLLPNTFSYPTTLTMAFLKAAYPVKFVPVRVLPRAQGASKINLLADGSRFFVIIMKIAIFFSPLKIFLPLSAIFFMMGLGYYLYTFMNFHRFTNMSALLFTTSVIIFMLGMISEQIAQLRKENAE